MLTRRSIIAALISVPLALIVKKCKREPVVCHITCKPLERKHVPPPLILDDPDIRRKWFDVEYALPKLTLPLRRRDDVPEMANMVSPLVLCYRATFSGDRMFLGRRIRMSESNHTRWVDSEYWARPLVTHWMPIMDSTVGVYVTDIWDVKIGKPVWVSSHDSTSRH